MDKLANSDGRLIFYYESEEIGGAQLLLARLADYLYKEGMLVSYICSEKGFLHKYLNTTSNIEFINIENINSYLFSSNDLIITPLSYIKRVMQIGISNGNVRLFFWDMHPYNYIEFTVFSFFYKKQNVFSAIFKKLEKSFIEKYSRNLESLENSGSLGFMCKKNLNYNKVFFGANVQERYLPICLDVPSFRENMFNFGTEKYIRIGWISRLDIDKVILLNDLIDSCIRDIQNTDIKLKIIIIGSGQARESVKRSPFLTIDFAGEMLKTELDDFLIKNVDCGFSVGTAALEFAKLSIPTFLVGGTDAVDFYANKSRKYLPIHYSKNYDIAVETYHYDQCLDLTNCLAMLKRDYHVTSKKSYQHVLQNHNTPVSARLLINYSRDATFTLASTRRLYKENILFKSFNTLKVLVKWLHG